MQYLFVWFLESSSKCNRPWALSWFQTPIFTSHTRTGASVKVPWPLVGTGKTQPLPFLLLKWVEVGRIFYSCLLESPLTAGGFGATGGEIHSSLSVLVRHAASVSEDFCRLRLVWSLHSCFPCPILKFTISKFRVHRTLLGLFP